MLDCEYTRKSFEPYEPYTHHFEKLKNEADEKLKKAKADLEDAERLDASVEVKAGLRKDIAKWNFIREQSKLFHVSLTGRNNMSSDRAQTIVTKSTNDVVCLLGDGIQYKHVQMDEFVINDTQWCRKKFHRGFYDENFG